MKKFHAEDTEYNQFFFEVLRVTLFSLEFGFINQVAKM